MKYQKPCLATIVWLLSSLALAQSAPQIPRTIPPPGIQLKPKEWEELARQTQALEDRLKQARNSRQNSKIAPRLPDVEIYHKAVSYALDHGEFFHQREVEAARKLIAQGNQRLDQLLAGKAPWTTGRGLVVRGYRSRLDDSVQPYGLVIPRQLDLEKPCRLIVWLHGRGNTLSEINFISQRQSKVGTVAPDNAIVLHPYGRYCNAFKFAGEVDVFEAIEDVKKNYAIDPNRIALWGFSMGGAGAWHLGAHHAGEWAVVSPGAGFADTKFYQRLKPDNFPPKHEQVLWGLFDVPGYVRNLFNVPVVAYSGELDKQKQAADLMAEAFAAEGQQLTHLIGPGMGHKYHPQTLKEILGRVEEHLSQGRNRFPQKVSLQTRTLRYNRVHWVEALALAEHWQDARIDARLTAPGRAEVTTKNVTGLRLIWPQAEPPSPLTVKIDGQELSLESSRARPVVTLEKTASGWRENARFGRGSDLRKLPGLQGPIDDVWMEPFLVVLPTGKSRHEAVGRWVQWELAHFQDRWRRLFRGDVRVKKDTEVTHDDMQKFHLVLWGDAGSNQLIGKIAPYLPVTWKNDGIAAGEQQFAAEKHVLAAIYPNPLLQRPSRYVVLNSGMTFREGHDRTNSLQNPKLGDWAVIDVSTPPDAVRPGGIAATGFFDEFWRLKK